MKCPTCAAGEHATLEEALACRTSSAEAAQRRADELPLGVYEKNGQRFRVMFSAQRDHNFAMLQDPQTHRYAEAPGAVKTLAREHLVKAMPGQPICGAIGLRPFTLCKYAPHDDAVHSRGVRA